MNEALAVATGEALKSTETFRLGAVLMEGGKVVASGRNRNLNPCGLPSIHAEMDAAWRVSRGRSPSRVVVVRLQRNGELGLSRPCRSCQRALHRLGVTRMTYSTGDPRAPLATEPLARAPPPQPRLPRSVRSVRDERQEQEGHLDRDCEPHELVTLELVQKVQHE